MNKAPVLMPVPWLVIIIAVPTILYYSGPVLISVPWLVIIISP